jgi:tRNA1Val (adenine37-N6)-methyltransferase
VVLDRRDGREQAHPARGPHGDAKLGESRSDHAGLILSQPERGYRYSLDPFLLADFCRPRRGDLILDLGAGVGVISLLLARRHPSVRVVGIELQPELAGRAARNARDNALAGRCLFIRGDLRDAPRFLPPERFNRVVANPPFRRPGSGATPADHGRACARQELTFTLRDLAGTAAALLRCGGSLDMIHLSERLPEIFRALDACGLEPKQLRLIAPFSGSATRLCLLSAIKGGRPGLRVLPQLVLHEDKVRLGGTEGALRRGGNPGRPRENEKHQPDR